MRVALAGLGRFGQVHAAVLAAMPGLELVAVADPDPQARERFALRHGAVPSFSDAEALLAAVQPQALVIATPDEQHPEQVLAALQRGCAVFAEKPLARSWRQAEQLRRSARELGCYLQVGLVLRYDLSHQLLQQQIRAGDFGELVSIRCQRNCSRRSFAQIAERVHAVHRTLSHDIDLALWLTGSRVVRVMAMEFRRGEQLCPQGCFALLEMANGCVVQLESSWMVPDQAPANVLGGGAGSCIDAELAVVGMDRSAKLRWLDGGLQIWGDQQLQVPDTALWPELDGRVHGAMRQQLEDFAAAVRSGTPSRVASLEDAVEGLRIAEAILEALQSGRPVELPLVSAESPPSR